MKHKVRKVSIVSRFVLLHIFLEPMNPNDLAALNERRRCWGTNENTIVLYCLHTNAFIVNLFKYSRKQNCKVGWNYPSLHLSSSYWDRFFFFFVDKTHGKPNDP